MSAASPVATAERKALLATRAELDRVRFTAAAHDVQAFVAPRRGEGGAGRGTASLLVGVAAPVLGAAAPCALAAHRLDGLTVYRMVRGWRRD